MGSVTDFSGKWSLVQQDGFEELMKARGVGFLKRNLAKAAGFMSPDNFAIEIQQDGEME